MIKRDIISGLVLI